MKRIKDDDHLAFVRSLPCCVCADNTSCEAAHLRAGSIRYAKRGTGMAEKPSDRWVLPLCSPCHRKQHGQRELNFWQGKVLDPFILAMTLFCSSGDYERACEAIAEQALQW